MPNAGIVAAALTDGSAHPYGLFIDSLDVLEEPGGHRYGVDAASIQITEAAPGGVSSMTFELDDPSTVVNIQDGAGVLAWDFTRDLPMFLGWVQGVESGVDFGNQGLLKRVTCYGIEALLDEIIVPSFTQDDTATNFMRDAVQGMAQYAPVRAFSNPGSASSQAFPVLGTLDLLRGSIPLPTGMNGLSIRRCWELWWATDQAPPGYPPAMLTIDFWGGLRLWPNWGVSAGVLVGGPPTDYASITIQETAGTRGENLRYMRDASPGSIITAVYVAGGTSAGTGWVAGDTTKGRHEAYISDATITTDAAKQGAAGALLNQYGSGAGRGTVTVSAFTPANAHPGSTLTITNSAMGWSSKNFVISQIDKTLLRDGRQDWTISFYDRLDVPSIGRPSAVNVVRRLTRGITQ